MSRSLRHPFKGPRHYLRPERERRTRSKRPRQPKMRQSRFSVEAMLDAPDSSESRPGIRLRIIALVVVALFALLGLRLWTLQVLQAPAAAQAVADDQIRAVTIEPTRGLILDRDGNPLASNVVTQQITLSRVAAVQYPAVVGRLAAVIGETTAQVKSTINDNQYSLYKPVPILSDAPLQDIQYIKEHQSEFPGVSVVATTQRAYPQSDFPGAGYPAEQALGYVGTISPTELGQSKGYQAGDPYGQAGLEYQYESELRGTPGQQQLEVNPQGQVVGTLKTDPAVSGDNVVTNIDTNLQQVADNALASQIAYVRKVPDSVSHMHRPAPNGAVVVLDAQTGAVLAMSSFPNYDPNIWVGGISESNYQAVSASGAQNNYAIQGQLPPGSTFKLVTATSALQSGLITPTYSFDDKGSYTAPGCTGPDCTLKDDVGDTPFGPINVSTALTVSSDTFFYNIGAMYWDSRAQYGPTPIQDTAALYGFGKPTGVDLPNEDQGLVDSLAVDTELHDKYPKAYPYPPNWNTGDNMELAFGQGATIVTPLQEAVAYATFANGGTRYAPQLAAAIVSPDGKVIKRIAPQVTGKVSYSPATYAALLAGFTGVVDQSSPAGTGYSDFVGSGWNQAAFPLAGKTGTASLIGPNGQPEEPVSWFVGFGPVPNSQYVVVAEINQGGYGADAAAPVVRNIFNYLAAHPVGPATIPPPESAIDSLTPLTLPATTAAGTTTTTTPSTGSTTPTTVAGGAGAGG